MQPRIILKSEMSIHGLRGDGVSIETLQQKFKKRFATKPFDKIGENAYEIRFSDGIKPAPVGRDVLVGHERSLKNNADGYNCIVLPAGEYAIFDVPAYNGCDIENGAMEKWLNENRKCYAKRELYDNCFILKCYTPGKYANGDKSDLQAEVWIPIFRINASIIPKLLEDPSFGYLSDADRNFISEFDDAMYKRGYSAGNTIVDGICWGRNMLIYSKVGVKSSSVAARIYMRDDGICLRLFLSNVSKHGKYIAGAPDFIKSIFTGEYGRCKHCKGDNCKFRKDYEIDGVRYEKCNGMTFAFDKPAMEKLPEYIKLFDEFFPQRKTI